MGAGRERSANDGGSFVRSTPLAMNRATEGPTITAWFAAAVAALVKLRSKVRARKAESKFLTILFICNFLFPGGATEAQAAGLILEH